MSDTQSFPLHAVEIDRGNNVITTEVPEHEIAVLVAVHGRAAVQDKGVTDEEIELSTSADAEFARLQRRYHRINATDPVGIAYRTGPDGLERFGFALGRGVGEAPAQSMNKKHPKPDKAKKAAPSK